jgi:hypothetical protein
VAASAFQSCSALTSVSLPKAETIGPQVFFACSALATVSLPKATSIGSHAFSQCNSLTEVKLGATPPSVENDIFTYTRGSSDYTRTIIIKFPANSPNTGWNATYYTNWGTSLPDGGVQQDTY